MFAGGVADGEALGLSEGLSSAVSANAGAVSERTDKAAEATNRDRRMIIFETGTVEKVQVLRPEFPSPFGGTASPSPPRRRTTAGDGDTESMKLSRPVSWFLLAFGVWSWVIWVTFAKNLWKDASGLAFDDAGDPTAYFWVHLTLAVVSFVLGTVVGVIGLRGVRALRQTP